MNKFKVGDKVRFINNASLDNQQNFIKKYGETGVICRADFQYVVVKFNKFSCPVDGFYYWRFELVEENKELKYIEDNGYSDLFI